MTDDVSTGGFLSTLSLRRATSSSVISGSRHRHFYPRSPCGERRVTVLGIQHRVGISIHALLAESDVTRVASTPTTVISIHALLAESDPTRTSTGCVYMYFYPRSPCGERLNSAYGALDGASISIHALLAESDRRLMCFWLCGLLFLSTLSLRRATPPGLFSLFGFLISIHALLAESDTRRILRAKLRPISIHALLAESDAIHNAKINKLNNFYPRSPCGERRVTVLGIQHRVGISIHALLAESDLASRLADMSAA